MPWLPVRPTLDSAHDHHLSLPPAAGNFVDQVFLLTGCSLPTLALPAQGRKGPNRKKCGILYSNPSCNFSSWQLWKRRRNIAEKSPVCDNPKRQWGIEFVVKNPSLTVRAGISRHEKIGMLKIARCLTALRYREDSDFRVGPATADTA